MYHQFLDFRRIIEPHATMLAATKATKEQRIELSKIYREMCRVAEDFEPEAWVNIDTPFHADKAPELREKIRGSIPMGRFGESEEVAPSFLFFASHACSGFITGQILDVNGGQIAP